MHSKKLIIVENNKKLMTLQEVLQGQEYIILSTGGYIKRIQDTTTKLGWTVNSKSKSFLNKIKDASSECNGVYLAMDDDSEGERLAWDVMEYLGHTEAHRIVLRQLDKKSIFNAIKNTRKIDKQTIDAQITRKIVERIIGKNISSLMKWYFIKEELLDEETAKNIGIGRVSAPALALIAEAEEKIDTFIPKFYKRVAVDYFINNTQFSVKNKLKFTKDKNEELLALVNMVNTQKHIISKYEKSTKDKLPPPPLNAAWLQRAASYQFEFTPKETMKIAKELYEGVMVDGKRVALITYPKTNSINLSDKIAVEIMQLLIKSYGEKYTYTSKRVYKKSNDENDSREAIRPISFQKEFFPKNIEKYLTREQFMLYEYIYLRTIATQMTSAIYDQSELLVSIGGATFKTVANKLLFDGWMLIGKYWKDDDESDMEEVTLPDGLIPGEEIRPIEVRTYEVKERSPWRYGEGRFITTLSKYSIADASFVSEITHYLKEKKYITILKSMIYPTELGKKVYYFMKQFTPWLVDIDLISKLQKDIELVAKGRKDKKEVILEYENLKNETQLSLGYIDEVEQIPQEWMVQKAKKIAKQKKQILGQEILGSTKRLQLYLNSNKEEIEVIGKCPACKQGDIFVNNQGYKCNNPDCNFLLWHSSVERFLTHFSKNIPNESISDYISIILKKGKCYFDDLYSAKKDKFFSSFVEIEHNDEYNNWSLSLAKLQTNDEISNYVPKAKAEKSEPHHKMAKENEYLKQQLEKEKREKRLILDSSKKDPLTRAFNRGCFTEDMKNIFSNAEKMDLSLAFVDGDHFKNVNDTYDHQAGDKVLQFLVNKMFAGIHKMKSAKVYRYGGEEFIIAFFEGSKKEIISCMNDIRQSVENEDIPWKDDNKFKEGTMINITISTGISFYKEGDTIDSLIARADKAVYKAKENGRNRIEVGYE